MTCCCCRPSPTWFRPRSTLQTRLTRNIQLNIPLISAAMDTVTESRMAIAMAQQGGLGIVHRNLTIEQQAGEVDKVKRSESGMIVDPITMSPDAKISDALEVMRHYRISGVPVTKDKKLVGILTNRDLRFETRTDIPISEVMTKENLITVPVGTTLSEAEAILHQHRVEKLLVVDEHYELKGLITVKDIQKKLKYPERRQGRAGTSARGRGRRRHRRLSGARAGDGAGQSRRAGHRQRARPLDARAGGHPRGQGEVPGDRPDGRQRRHLRRRRELIACGADGVKVGIGPGSICTTRVVTGAGVPQITAIAEAARATRDSDVPIIADGGIKYSGDITKAIAAGASCVMIGSLLAGTEESPGETILYQGRTFKTYRGMGSLGAMAQGSSERYFQN